MTIPTGGYPKMPFAVDSITGRTTNLVYPGGSAKQGTYVIFNSVAEETAYDNTGITSSGLPSVHENKHHK